LTACAVIFSIEGAKVKLILEKWETIDESSGQTKPAAYLFGRQAHFHARRQDDSRCAEVYRALGNDSDKDVSYMILGAVPPKNFPAGNRTLLGDGDSQPQEGSALENAVAGSSFPELASSMCDDTAAHPASVSCAMRTSPSPSDENR
jgi:hypothetical protein